MATQRMLIDATQKDETRVALVKESELLDFDFESQSKKSIKGNIYLAKIVRIEPSLQAAFVEYGRNRHGFLAFTEIHPDYFRIPVADREEAIDEGLGEPENAIPSQEEPKESSEDSSTEATAETETKKSSEKDNSGEEEVRRKYALYRSYKIQEVIQSRQIVLIQVVKEERGNKGAALTTFVSLAGRYSVLMPNALNPGGISRKITESDDRKRLKKLIADLEVPEGMSLIVRTAGLDKTKTEIKKDYSYLINLWSKIREKTLSATAPDLIHEEPSLIRRVLRDVYTPDISEILIEGEEGYKDAKSFMKILIPSHAKKIKQYKEAGKTLFKQYNIESQIEQIFSPQVKLRSGGYLVINATEALVAVDVNSGRATRERHIDSTALKTNLEAAEEVARQIRIRDLSGLIVIDFIDMSEVRHNIAVERRLKESLSMDRARIQVARISQFGLLEMSRQRLRSSILEASSSRCPHCLGSGLMRSKESLSVQLLRVLEDLSGSHSVDSPLTVKMDTSLAFFLLGNKLRELEELKEKRGAFFTLKQSEALGLFGFLIENKEGDFLTDSAGKSIELEPSDENKRRRNSPSQQRRRKSKKSPSENSDTKEIAPSSREEEKKSSETDTPKAAQEPSDSITTEEKKSGRNRNRRNRRRYPKPKKESDSTSSEETGDTSKKKESSSPSIISSSTSEKEPSKERKEQGGEPQDPKNGWWKKLLD
jgi:ribonuclease E